MRYVLLVLLFCLIGLASAGEYISLSPELSRPTVQLVSGDLTQMEAELRVPGIQIYDTTVAGVVYQRLQISEMGNSVEVGKPEVPVWVKLFGIANQGHFSAEVVDVQYRTIKNINLFPAQPQPKRLGQKLPWTIDQKFYASDQWYPENYAQAEAEAIFREYRVLPVRFNPVQYNPRLKELRVAERVSVRIRRTAGTPRNELSANDLQESAGFRPLYREFIVNYPQIRKTRTPGLDGMPNMLIITHDAYYNEVLPFAEWKNQKGIKTVVVKTSEIGTNPTSNLIKNYIQTYYDNAQDKPDYLLIVGDVTGTNAVPWFSVSGSKSDLPYYFLAGNDILPDISGGRISVQTTAEANIVFTKLVRYEKQPYLANQDWFHSAFVINSNDFQDPLAGNWAKAQFTNYGYNPVHHIGDNMGNATIANVYNAVNSGVSYVYYIGHGAPTYWVTTGFSTTHIPGLTNGEMQPVISSVACNNADLDEPNDVFAEVWLKNSVNNGSVGIMAFTESCAVYETDTLARGMVRAVLSDTITAFGRIVDYGRLHMFQSYGNACSEPMHQSLLVGEPSLEVWTRTPQPLTVNMPQAAFFGIPFTVQVSDAQGPVEGIMVCFSDSLGNMVRGFTDANGEIMLDHGVNLPVTGVVTVTGHNYVPLQQNIDILPPQGPYVMSQNPIVKDTLNNGNGIAEAGERIFLQFPLKNIGVDPAQNVQVAVSSPDSLIEFLEDSISLGNISPDSTVMAGWFKADIDANCPHLHTIPLEVKIMAAGGNLWVQNKSLRVRKGATISLDGDTLNFSPTFLHFTSQEVMLISNTGEDTLFISEMSSDSPQFTLTVNQLAVAPGRQVAVAVNFTPDTNQVYEGHITIQNSDPLQFVKTFTVKGEGIFAPALHPLPDSLVVEALQTDSLTRELTLENTGLGELTYNVQVRGYNPNAGNRGSGGADTFGHIWIDSDEAGGPAFDWVDISTTGTEVQITGNNAISGQLQLGFNFSFYGIEYDRLRVCTNGWLSFTTFSVAYNNVALPSNLAPRALLAPLWDNLFLDANAKVYAQSMGDRFIVQYQNVHTVTGSGPYTFQAILFDNGNIKFQYLQLDSLENAYTVGIQNHNATDGLTIAFNEAYLHDSLAVLISKHSWLKVAPMAGTIPPQSQTTLTATIQTHSFPLGEFYAGIQIESNDPANPQMVIPVHLIVALTGMQPENAILPRSVQLAQNYPNPFNPETVIRFALPHAQKVELAVYNLLGQKVKTLVSGNVEAGMHEVKWDATNDWGARVGSGIYIYRLKTADRMITHKMVLLK
ncbi:MAG: hypothetical protein Kow0037_17550 [Calditrichia bacterium]